MSGLRPDRRRCAHVGHLLRGRGIDPSAATAPIGPCNLRRREAVRTTDAESEVSGLVASPAAPPAPGTTPIGTTTEVGPDDFRKGNIFLSETARRGIGGITIGFATLAPGRASVVAVAPPHGLHLAMRCQGNAAHRRDQGRGYRPASPCQKNNRESDSAPPHASASYGNADRTLSPARKFLSASSARARHYPAHLIGVPVIDAIRRATWSPRRKRAARRNFSRAVGVKRGNEENDRGTPNCACRRSDARQHQLCNVDPGCLRGSVTQGSGKHLSNGVASVFSSRSNISCGHCADLSHVGAPGITLLIPDAPACACRSCSPRAAPTEPRPPARPRGGSGARRRSRVGRLLR